MITCPGCGRQAADDAVVYPECGESLLDPPAPLTRLRSQPPTPGTRATRNEADSRHNS